MLDESYEPGTTETLADTRTERFNESLDSITEFDFEARENQASESQEHQAFQSDQVIRKSDESLLVRLRIFLWVQHQPLIAGLLFLCLIGMSAYFVQRSYVHSGLIELDRSGALSADFQVDINTAELGEIVVLPGVGEKLGQAIVDYRTRVGRFDSFQMLKQVPGIGEKKLAQLVPYLVPFNRDIVGE